MSDEAEPGRTNPTPEPDFGLGSFASGQRVTERKPPRKSKRTVTTEQLGILGSLAFNLIAAVRGGSNGPAQHWMKTPDDLLPITEPTVSYLQSLPAKQAAKIEGVFTPISILAGFALVLAQPIATEVEILNARRLRKAQMNGYKSVGVPKQGQNVSPNNASQPRQQSSGTVSPSIVSGIENFDWGTDPTTFDGTGV